MSSNLGLLAFGVIMLSGKLLKRRFWNSKALRTLTPLVSFHDNIRHIDFELRS